MMPLMKIGIDIDGTITHAPAFFRLLTAALHGKDDVAIHIITARGGPLCREHDQVVVETAEELAELGIKYDTLACLGPLQKLAYIEQHDIDVMFDDTDEEVIAAPERCTVFKIREDMNFCWDTNRWLHSKQTSRDITDEQA